MSDPATAIPNAHGPRAANQAPAEDWVREWQAGVDRAMDRLRHPDEAWIGQWQAAVSHALGSAEPTDLPALRASQSCAEQQRTVIMTSQQLDEEWGSTYLEACKAALEGCLGLDDEWPPDLEFTLVVNDDDSPALEITFVLNTDWPTRVHAFGWDSDDGWHYTLAPVGANMAAVEWVSMQLPVFVDPADFAAAGRHVCDQHPAEPPNDG
jgi:hypothetical protein